MRTLCLLILSTFGMLFTTNIWAGGGPANCLVLYDPADASAVAVANYYQQLRDIPDVNMMPYYFPTTPAITHSNLSYVGLNLTTNQAYQLIADIRSTLSSRNLSNQIDVILLVGSTPTTFTSGGGGLASLTSLLSDLPQLNSLADVGAWGSQVNSLYRGDADSYGSWGPYPNLNATEIRHDKLFSNPNSGETNRAYVAFTMGFSGWRGNTAVETFNVLQRARISDGTLTNPALRGTVYWPTNNDVRFHARKYEMPATNEWAALGIPYAICKDGLNGLDGVGSTPVTNRSIMGLVGSWAAYNLAYRTGTTYVPGAIGDTLTSFAGAYQNAGQGKLTEYFRAGLAGSAGTVTEPFAIKEKFLHARVYSHYANGASLGEAFYQSVFWLFELLMGGDPLTQPFADIPAVTVSAPAEGATVSGTLAVSASATAVSGVESNLDLAVDGRIVRPGLPAGETISATRVAGGFSLDTTTLSDGCHELRLIAYNTKPVRSQGYALRNVTVNNLGMSVTLSAPATLDRRDSGTFIVTPTGLSGATNLAIRFLGQTLTNLSIGGGTVSLPGTRFGFYGTNTVYAVAALSNGRQVASAPQKLVLTWSPRPATNVVLNTNALAHVRYFLNVNTPGFSWDTNPPDATFFYTDPATNGLFFSPSLNNPFPYSPLANTNVGHEFTTYFNAPQEYSYDFVVSGDTDKKSLFIDGAPMFTNVAAIGSSLYPVVVTEKLAAGLHQIVFRGVGSSRLKIGVRGADIVATNFWQPSDEVPLTSHRNDFNATGDLVMGTPASPGPNSYAPNWAVNPPPAPPTAVAITSPVTGTIVTSTNVLSLSASVSYPTSSNLPITVRYYSGSTLLGSSTNGPNYDCVSIALASGTYALRVEAQDRFYQTISNGAAIVATIGALSAPTAYPPGGFFPTNVSVWLNHEDASTRVYYTSNSYFATASTLVLTNTGLNVPAGGSITVLPRTEPVTLLRMMAQKAGANQSAANVYAFRQGWGTLAAGGSHALALKADGALAGWGGNSAGQLGLGNTSSAQTSPAAIAGLSNVVAVAGGDLHSLAVDQFAQVWAWGDNFYGQLANGGNSNSASPVMLTDTNLALGIRAVAAGIGFSLALRQDGYIYAWGDNSYGQIGNGKTTVYNYLTPVKGATVTFTLIAAGGYHALGLTRNPGASIYAWGRGDDGQLGRGSNTNGYTAVLVSNPGSKSFTAVAAGLGHSLALCTDKTVYAWGRNTYGQLGTGTTFSSNAPVQLSGLANIVAIAAGASHTLALDATGQVWTWGRNHVGQLGYGTKDNSAHSTPAAVSGLTNVQAIFANANSDTSYALKTNGTIVAWGEGSKGQLGNGAALDGNSPTSVSSLRIIPPAEVGITINLPTVAISAPADGDLFFGTNSVELAAQAQGGTPPLSVLFSANGVTLGTVASAPYHFTWTGMTNGVYTLGATVTDAQGLSSNAAPVQVVFTAVPTVMQAPEFHPPAGSYRDIQNVTVSCADTNVVLHYTLNGNSPAETDPTLALGGTLLLNRDAFLKMRAFASNQNPGPVATALYCIGTSRRSLSAGDTHVLTRGGDGLVHAWGVNWFGEAGLGNETPQPTPAVISSLSNVVAVAAGSSSSLAIDWRGRLYSWGANFSGQLGNNTMADTNVPVAVSGLSANVLAAAMGGGHAIAMKADGTVSTWGGNDLGQLGHGFADTNYYPVPIMVTGLVATAVAAGAFHNLVLATNGTVWAFGYNSSGQLGTGPSGYGYETSPLIVSNLSGVRAVVCGTSASFALKTNGTVWAWGFDLRGSLGIGPAGSVNYFPAQVLNLPTNIVALAAGHAHTLALDSNGTVWTWGGNFYGQLGIGTIDNDNHPYPAALPGLAGVVAIAGGYDSAYALKADGSVWAWGHNADGQLGDGSGADQPAPVNVSGLTLPPGLTAGIFQPGDFSYTLTNTVTLTGAAFGPSGIQSVTANGSPATTANALTNWSVTVGGLTGGTNLITVVTTNGLLPAGVLTNQLRVLYADNAFSSVSDVWLVADVVNGVTNWVPITVSDRWKMQYFGTNFLANTNSSGAADPLGQGMPNWMKFMAGLNPLDPNDRLVSSAAPGAAPGTIQVQWASKPGIKYRVRYTHDFMTWTDLGVITASSTVTTWTDNGSETGLAPSVQPQRFYWLKAVP